MVTRPAVGQARQVCLPGTSLPDQVKRADYLDALAATVSGSDTRTPEALSRDALERSGPLIREGIRFAHKAFLLFQLGPTESLDHILGWRIVDSTPDAIHLRAGSPPMSGTLTLRRADAPYLMNRLVIR